MEALLKSVLQARDRELGKAEEVSPLVIGGMTVEPEQATRKTSPSNGSARGMYSFRPILYSLRRRARPATRVDESLSSLRSFPVAKVGYSRLAQLSDRPSTLQTAPLGTVIDVQIGIASAASACV